MALRTVSNTGGLWNATTTWVGGVVPIAGDDVDFTATSGNLTVNVSTANLVGINFTNYVGTITFNADIVVNTSVNLGTGGYTQAGSGTFGLSIQPTTTFTITSNGVVWNNSLSFFGSSRTYTLVDNLTVTGNITISGAVSSTFSGNTLYIGGNLTVTTSVTIFGTTEFVFNGNGTWSHSTNGIIQNNVTINTGGTLTIGTNIYYRTGTLTYTAGTVITTGSTLNITQTTTLNTGGMTWNNVTITAGTQTLTSDLNLTGNLTTQTSIITINGLFNVNVSGNLTINVACSGTATIILNGTGNQTWSHASAVYLSNSLTINKSSGTLSIGTNVYYNTNTLTYTTGTVDTTTNNSTLNINTSTTLNTGVVNWNNVSISLSSSISITLSSNLNITGTTTFTHASAGNLTLSFSGVGTLNPSGPLTIINNSSSNFSFTITIPNSLTITNLTLATGFINNGHSIILNNNTINVTGNLTVSGTINFTVLGTTNLNLTGTGIWSHTGASRLINNLTINSPSGTITISGNVYYNTGTLTYTSGTTIITTGSTLNINASSTLDTSGMTWNNVILSGTQTLTSGLNIGGNLTTQSTAVVLSGVVNVNVSGSLTINTTTSGTAAIILNGTGTWSATSYLSNNLTINTGGILTIGTNIYYNTGTLTYTTGTVNTTTNNSTLNINTSITLDTSGITWNNITILLQSNTNSTITLSSNLNITGTTTFTHASAGNLTLSFSGVGSLNSSGALTINNNSSSNFSFTITIPISLTITNLTLATGFINNVHSIILNNNSININGNLLISGTGNFTVLGTTNLNLTGTGTWSHTSISQLRNNLTLNSPSGTITISGNVYYNTGTLTHISGTVTTTGSTLFIGLVTTLNTSGMTWNNVTLVGTQTLTSDLNVGGNLTTQTTAVVLSGVVNVNVSGSLIINVGTSGTATIILIGTGTWSATSYLSNNLTINTAGTITVSGNVYYQTGALTYTTGTVTTTSSTLNMSGVAPTLNTNGITWNNVTINITTNTTFTLSSNFNSTGLLSLSSSVLTSALSFAGIGLFNPSGALSINISHNAANSVFTITLPNTITITNLTCSCTVTTPMDIVLNGNSINITGNLTQLQGQSYFIIVRGTTNLNLIGTGTWTGSNFFNAATYTMTIRNNLTINTSGTITISANVYYNTGTLTYIAGTVNTTLNNSTLNITTASTLNIGGPSWNNIALTGTQTLLSNIVCTGTLSTGISTINGLFTITTNNLTIGGATVINTTSVTASGNLAIFGNTSGTSPITLIGTGTWSANSYLANNLTINTPGTITVSGNVYYQTGTLTYTTGTVTTTGSTLNMAGVAPILNTNTIIWNNVTISISANATFTLSSNFNNTGTLSLTAINVSVNPTLSFTGVGLLNSSGALIVNNAQNVGSRIFTITLPNTITVTNVWFGCSSTTPETIVLNGNSINITGNLTHLGNLTLGGNYNITVSGTTNLFLTGTGTWSATYFFNTVTYAMTIQNNLTINTSGTITISGTVLYNTGTLTYTAGTVNTTGSTLAIGVSTTLNTNGIIWNAISWSGGTLTLSSILTTIGLITASHNFPVINGSDLYANGGFNFTASNFNPNYSFISGNSTIIFEGSGSWTSPSNGTFRNNVIINPTGNFSINIFYITGTITYNDSNGGTVTSASVTLGYFNSLSGAGGPRSATFNTNNMRWDYIYVMDYTNAGQPGTIITCVSNLNVGFFGFANIGTGTNVNIGISLSAGVDIINLSNLYIDGRITLNLPKDIVTDTLQFNTGLWWRVNNFSIKVKRLLTISSIGGNTSIDGTTKVIMMDNTTYQRTDINTNPLLLNMEIEGNITFRATSAPLLTYGGSSITYTGSKSSTAKGTLLLSTNATLLNFDKLAFQNLIVTSGINLTMNQFTSGLPNFKSNISASSTTNYTITFQDGFEKFAKFIKLSRATISRPNQLTVITDKGNQGNNVGVKFAPNQLANGLPKNTSTTSTVTPYGLQPSYLVTDPTLS